MPDYFLISGGYVYDPANGIDGQVKDLWVSECRIVEPPRDASVRPARVLNAAGLVVMPGGIDMHCHIAGPKVNAARKMRPEEKRKGEKIHRTSVSHSGTMGSVPSTFATGYKYIGLGYTTAFDAAVPPLAARHTHEEFEDTPCIDKGFYILMGNNHYVMRAARDGDDERLAYFTGWLLGAAKAYACKLVNPGGVEVWKQQASGNVRQIDENVEHFDVTPRQVIQAKSFRNLSHHWQPRMVTSVKCHLPESSAGGCMAAVIAAIGSLAATCGDGNAWEQVWKAQAEIARRGAMVEHVDGYPERRRDKSPSLSAGRCYFPGWPTYSRAWSISSAECSPPSAPATGTPAAAWAFPPPSSHRCWSGTWPSFGRPSP
jgi:formylmethanofuran dehydrogenase subunit A